MKENINPMTGQQRKYAEQLYSEIKRAGFTIPSIDNIFTPGEDGKLQMIADANMTEAYSLIQILVGYRTIIRADQDPTIFIIKTK